ncbi:MAG: hypothetical protein ACI9T7_001903 [Oleiphilaceae bacterium]|jgi:hypothetical protein
MGKVIKFPSNERQGMTFLEEGIRELMLSKGESEASINITLKILKDVYKEYGDIGKQHFELKLPSYIKEEHVQFISDQVTEGVKMLNKDHARVINKLASQLVLTKLALYRCSDTS